MFELNLISLQVTIDYRKYSGLCTQQHYKSLHLLCLADMSNFNVIVNKVRDQSLFSKHLVATLLSPCLLLLRKLSCLLALTWQTTTWRSDSFQQVVQFLLFHQLLVFIRCPPFPLPSHTHPPALDVHIVIFLHWHLTSLTTATVLHVSQCSSYICLSQPSTSILYSRVCRVYTSDDTFWIDTSLRNGQNRRRKMEDGH